MYDPITELNETRQQIHSLRLHMLRAPRLLQDIAEKRAELDLDEKAILNLFNSAPARIEELEKKLKNLTDLEVAFPVTPASPIARTRAKFELALKQLCTVLETLPSDHPMRKKIEMDILKLADKLQ